MSKNEKDLSLFIAVMSNASLIFSIIAGFIFTAITLLVTLLPDPSQLAAQATLFTLAVLCGLSIISINDIDQILIYTVRVIPPLPKGFGKRSDFLGMIVVYLLGLPIILMFLLWNLTYLSLATLVTNALLVLFAYFHTKPLRDMGRRFKAQTGMTWRIRRFFDERDIIFEGKD